MLRLLDGFRERPGNAKTFVTKHLRHAGQHWHGEGGIRTGGKTPKESATSTRGGAQSGALANNPQLASIFEAWNELPEAVKAGILAMTKAARQ
jgi:hypothetical protein